MAVNQGIVDHLSGPGIALRKIDDYLVSMPRFDRSDIAGSSKMPQDGLTGSAVRPGGRIPFTNLRTRPFPIRTRLKQVDSRKACRQQGLFLRAVPENRRHRVLYAFICVADQCALPFAGTVEDHGYMRPIVGRQRVTSRKGSVDEHGISVSEHIGPPQPVAGRKMIDCVSDSPGFSRVAIVM